MNSPTNPQAKRHIGQILIDQGILTEDQLRIADFSNASPIITAPGVDIVSASADGALAKMSGTSMASPHAAGIAALWWDHLRTQGNGVSARHVAAQLSVSARKDVFFPGFSRADFGDGLATAPKTGAKQ